MDVLLAKLPGDPVANAAAIGAVVLALLDFLFGTARAVAGGTFELGSFSTWVRAQLMGHVIPIVLLLSFGQVIGTITIGDMHLNVLVAAGLAAAASYAATTIGSITDSLNAKAPDPVPPPAT
jgi:hypothetical protein